jgi:hypothetical protein
MWNTRLFTIPCWAARTGPLLFSLLLCLCPAGTQVLDLEAEKKFSNGAVTIKGFATIDNVCLINIEGTGMVGVPGT